jgi:hypothetical protein
MFPVPATKLHRLPVEGTGNPASDVPTTRRRREPNDGNHTPWPDEGSHPSYALDHINVMQHGDGRNDIEGLGLEDVREHVADDELDAIGGARIQARPLDARLVTVDCGHMQTARSEVEREQTVA